MNLRERSASGVNVCANGRVGASVAITKHGGRGAATRPCSTMILVNLINTLTKSEIGTFILCETHFKELEASHIPQLFNVRLLTSHFQGECIQCTEGEATPIDFDEVPENIEVYVTFNDDSGETWTASGRAGHLVYLANKGEIFTTREALKRRGVAKLYIEAGYEVHLDED